MSLCARVNTCVNACVNRGADDLLPVLTYVLAKARVHHVMAHAALMEKFLHDSEVTGKLGFSVVTLAMALGYLEKDGRSLVATAAADDVVASGVHPSL